MRNFKVSKREGVDYFEFWNRAKDWKEKLIGKWILWKVISKLFYLYLRPISANKYEWIYYEWGLKKVIHRGFLLLYFE